LSPEAVISPGRGHGVTLDRITRLNGVARAVYSSSHDYCEITRARLRRRERGGRNSPSGSRLLCTSIYRFTARAFYVSGRSALGDCKLKCSSIVAICFFPRISHSIKYHAHFWFFAKILRWRRGDMETFGDTRPSRGEAGRGGARLQVWLERERER